MEYKIKTLNAISSAIYTQLDDKYKVADDVANPQGILVRSASMHDTPIDDSVLCIARAGAGYNNIPVDACSEKGICVFNTPGANANAVAEMVLAGMLLSCRNIVGGIEWTRTLKGQGAAVEKAVEAFSSVDIVCNFAGGTAVRMRKVDRQKHPEFPDVPIEVYDWGIDVNLKGPFYFAHAVMKQMREQQGGLIVNIGSITGQEGDGYGMDYPTSKAGLMFGLTKSIARFGSKYGIRCNCVSPGPVMTRAAMANMKTLLGRAAEPREIIDLVLFLASDKGQFINGENIMIDGGRNAAPRRC